MSCFCVWPRVSSLPKALEAKDIPMELFFRRGKGVVLAVAEIDISTPMMAWFMVKIFL